MNVMEQETKKEPKEVYTKPQKRIPPKPPAKPDFPRPASARN